MNFVIRKVIPSDFDKLVSLYDGVWADVDYDKRKKANFILRESIGIHYCAEADGQIVGSRTSCFQNMYCGKKKLICVQIGDSCVRKDFRGRGLFIKMNQAFLNDFFSEDNKGELIYNISVFASRKAYEKLGWNYIKSLMALRQLARPFHIAWCTKLRLKHLSVPIKWDKINDDVNIDPVLLQKREELLSNGNLLHICYDENTLKWRMKSKSGIRQFSVNGLGSIIFKRGKRGQLIDIEIGEIFLYDYSKRNLKIILHEFKSVFLPDILTVLISEGHPLKKMYESLGFYSNPKQKYLHHGVRVETDEMKRICYNPHNWAISSLDIDTF